MEKIGLEHIWMWLAAILNAIAYVLFGLYIKRWKVKWEKTFMHSDTRWEERIRVDQMFL